MNLPFSPACERNRDPILAVLRHRFAPIRQVLEIGSGTGQHAVHFAAALPGLRWQTSDLPANLPGIRAWLDEAGLSNTPAPLELDVTGPLPAGPWDAVFSANTLHIMGWPEVQSLFTQLSRPEVLAPGGLLVVYGPFKYGGQHTSASAWPGTRAWPASRMPRCRRTTGC
jgi:cyclopropane fatty-acyl-phospholipid synthase-like methyltransferase